MKKVLYLAVTVRDICDCDNTTYPLHNRVEQKNHYSQLKQRLGAFLLGLRLGKPSNL